MLGCNPKFKQTVTEAKNCEELSDDEQVIMPMPTRTKSNFMVLRDTPMAAGDGVCHSMSKMLEKEEDHMM